MTFCTQLTIWCCHILELLKLSLLLHSREDLFVFVGFKKNQHSGHSVRRNQNNWQLDKALPPPSHQSKFCSHNQEWQVCQVQEFSTGWNGVHGSALSSHDAVLQGKYSGYSWGNIKQMYVEIFRIWIISLISGSVYWERFFCTNQQFYLQCADINYELYKG